MEAYVQLLKYLHDSLRKGCTSDPKAFRKPAKKIQIKRFYWWELPPDMYLMQLTTIWLISRTDTLGQRGGLKKMMFCSHYYSTDPALICRFVWNTPSTDRACQKHWASQISATGKQEINNSSTTIRFSRFTKNKLLNRLMVTLEYFINWKLHLFTGAETVATFRR